MASSSKPPSPARSESSTYSNDFAAVGDYGSEIADSELAERRKLKLRSQTEDKMGPPKPAKLPPFMKNYLSGRGGGGGFGRVALNAYEQHVRYINNYVNYYGKKDSDRAPTTAVTKTDFDIIRENYRFIREDEDNDDSTWEKRIARRYYERLFREYCLADLSRYREKKVGLRWRVEKEVFVGKGQFSCGEVRCAEKSGLHTFEVNFAYVESGERKNALVKLRLCERCGMKLEKVNPNYSKKAAKERRRKLLEQKLLQQQQQQEHSEEDEDDEEAGAESERGKRVRSPTGDEPESSKRTKLSGEEQKTREQLQQQRELESQIWSQKPEMEKTRDEEFDDYFKGMFP